MRFQTASVRSGFALAGRREAGGERADALAVSAFAAGFADGEAVAAAHRCAGADAVERNVDLEAVAGLFVAEAAIERLVGGVER